MRHSALKLVDGVTPSEAPAERGMRDLAEWTGGRSMHAAVLAASHDAILIVDASLSILSANAAAERLFGWPTAAGGALSFARLLDDGDRTVRGALADVLHRGTTHVCTSSFVRRDGQRFPGTMSVVPIAPSQGRIAQLVVTIRDDSRVNRLERQLARLQRFELVGRLAGPIAHDIGNELGVVIGYASALQGEDSVNADGRLDLQTIQEAAERAAALPERLQRLCRRPASAVVVSLAPLLCSLEGSLRQLGGRKVQVNVERDAVGTVVIDPAALEQVILTMAMSACDEMVEGGCVTVRAHVRDTPARATVTARRWVAIEVSNTAPCTPDAVCQGPVIEGSLGVVAQIVAEAQGRLQIERASTGTTFRIDLPEAGESYD